MTGTMGRYRRLWTSNWINMMIICILFLIIITYILDIYFELAVKGECLYILHVITLFSRILCIGQSSRLPHLVNLFCILEGSCYQNLKYDTNIKGMCDKDLWNICHRQVQVHRQWQGVEAKCSIKIKCCTLSLSTTSLSLDTWKVN